MCVYRDVGTIKHGRRSYRAPASKRSCPVLRAPVPVRTRTCYKVQSLTIHVVSRTVSITDPQPLHWQSAQRKAVYSSAGHSNSISRRGAIASQLVLSATDCAYEPNTLKRVDISHLSCATCKSTSTEISGRHDFYSRIGLRHRAQCCWSFGETCGP